MESDIQNPASSAKSQSPPQTFATSNGSKPNFQQVLEGVTKFTVFAVFGLYSMGFLIWRTHLANYGVSSVGFLQIEYLSAALCYLIFLTATGLPPALLYKRWLGRKEKVNKTPFDLVFFTFLIWSCAWLLFDTIFLRAHLFESIKLRSSLRAIFCLFFPYSGFWFLCLKKWPKSRITLFLINYLNPASVFTLSVSGLIMMALLFHPAISQLFLLSTSVSIVAAWHFGRTIQPDWSTMHFVPKLLVISASCLVVIINLVVFGTEQFGKIARETGGGRPESAFLRLSSQHLDLVEPLNLSAADGARSNNIFGPISILLRTEKEIIFGTQRDLCPPLTITNILTNLSSILITNVATNGAVTYKTNVISMLQSNIVKNPVKPKATQLRSELIDAIIFIRTQED